MDTNVFDYGSFYKQKKMDKIKIFFLQTLKVRFTGTEINADRVIQ